MGFGGFRASAAGDGAFGVGIFAVGKDHATAAPRAASFFCNSCKNNTKIIKTANKLQKT